MTREQAQQEREAFNAFCDGNEIQERCYSQLNNQFTDWICMSNPQWEDNREHRIKPTPRMVPLQGSDVPPGSIITGADWPKGEWGIIAAVTERHFMAQIGINGGLTQFNFLDCMTGRKWEHIRISRDGGRTWSKCEK